MVDFQRFDYETNRAVYSECQSTKCPNLEVLFIEQFLKRNYKVVFVTINQPYRKIIKPFIIRKNLFFIDAATLPEYRNKEEKVFYVDKELQSIDAEIKRVWDSIEGKKMLFFDCGELIFEEFEEKQSFYFVHQTVQRLQIDGIVIFCFLKKIVDNNISEKVRHLFDEVIYV